MPAIPLAAKSDAGRRGVAGSERLVNMYAEANPRPSASPFTLYRTPGLTTFSTPSSGLCRGLLEVDGTLLSVHTQSVFSVTTGGVATNIGTVAGAGTVIMARNQRKPNPQTVIVADGITYVVTGSSVTSLSDPDLPTPNSVDFLDGYFVFGIDDGRIFTSDINDTNVNALAFATAEGSPDGLRRVIRYRREIYAFGSQSLEVWANAGTSPFPLGRIPGAVVDVGIAGKYAVTVVSDVLVWVDHTGIVRRMGDGYQGTRISNTAVEAALATVAGADIELFGYRSGGHVFIVVSTPTSCFVWDDAEQLWHERLSANQQTWQGRHLATLSDGRIIVGSRLGGTLYTLDAAKYDEAGGALPILIRTPLISTFPAGAVVNELSLQIEGGVGAGYSAPETDQDPQLSLRWSTDFSKTWRGTLRRSIGRIGQHDREVKFNRLGRVGKPGITFELSASAAVPIAITAANVEAEERDV